MPTILITGANRGLGLEFARQYAADGWEVIACCRLPEAAEELNALAGEHGTIRIEQVDITDPSSVADLAGRLRGVAIDNLLHNAGTYGFRSFAEGGMEDQSFGSMDYANWELCLAVNTLAPLRLTEALIDNVKASDQKKICTISSSMGSIADSPGAHYAYGSSKAAVNFVMKTLSMELAEAAVTVLCLHPGWVHTGMGGAQAPLEPPESCAGLKKVMDSAGTEQSGKFLDYEGNELRW